MVTLTLREQGLETSTLSSCTKSIPAFLCPVHVMYHTWKASALFRQWACIRSICEPIRSPDAQPSCRLAQIHSPMCVHHQAWRSPPLGPEPSQSTDRRRPSTAPHSSPHPHSITLSVFTRWLPLMRMYMYAWIKHEIHCFLVADALTTSSFLMGAHVWSPSLNRELRLIEFVAALSN